MPDANAAVTPGSLVKTALDSLFSNVVKDELQILQAPADTYLNNIIANPAPDNVVAQSLSFVPTTAALLPNMEASGAKDAATAIKALIDSLVPSLVAQAAALVAPPAALPAVDPAPTPDPAANSSGTSA